jgi:hypothetical protein
MFEIKENSDYFTKQHLSALFVGLHCKAQFVSWWSKNFRFKCHLNVLGFQAPNTLEWLSLRHCRRLSCYENIRRCAFSMAIKKREPLLQYATLAAAEVALFRPVNTRLQRLSGAYKWNWGQNSQGSIQDPLYRPGVACGCTYDVARYCKASCTNGQRYTPFASRSCANWLVLLCAPVTYQIPKFWYNWAEFPVSWKIHP